MKGREYEDIKGKQDCNIDFRRVQNLKVYFERNQIYIIRNFS